LNTASRTLSFIGRVRKSPEYRSFRPRIVPPIIRGGESAAPVASDSVGRVFFGGIVSGLVFVAVFSYVTLLGPLCRTAAKAIWEIQQ
jgi:hypothetical protein